jgi:hypothetical protein
MRDNKGYFRVTVAVATAILFSVPVFELYAYYLQFREFGLGDLLLWIALILTVAIISLTFYLILAGWR